MKQLRIFKRTFKDLWPIARKSYLVTFVWSCFTFSIPFINFVYMGWALSALSQGNYSEVYQLVIQYVLIFTGFQIMSVILEPINQRIHEETQREIDALPNQKMLTMNFHYADNSEIQEQRQQINRDMHSNNSSFNMIYQHTRSLINHIVSLNMAILLLIPLWLSSGGDLAAQSWLHSWWLNVAVIFMVIIVILSHAGLSMWAMMQVGKIGATAMKINNSFAYYINLLKDPESGKEVRLYKIHRYIARFLEETQEWVESFYQVYYKGWTLAEISSSIGSKIIQWILYIVIGARVLVGSLPVGMVVQLIGAIGQLMETLQNMMSFFTLFAQSDPMERFYALMDLPDELEKGSLPIEKRLDNRYQLSVEDLHFTYPNSDQEILRGITENFEIGKHYAIVGENGSGKTTFIKLLMRLYEPNQGKVSLNKIDANKYSLNEYYQLFSVVFQDFRLLGMTLGENIAVSPNYDESKIRESIDQVDLSEFIDSLTHGTDTYLGTEYDKSGVNVSGGQAQKIAMARALYKGAPIMILDEPTAALDPVAEFEIYQNFSNMVQDKTAFYISHRLSSCRFCDEILVFDQGQVIQRGSHHDLLKQDGKYRELWQAQAQYYR